MEPEKFSKFISDQVKSGHDQGGNIVDGAYYLRYTYIITDSPTVSDQTFFFTVRMPQSFVYDGGSFSNKKDAREHDFECFRGIGNYFKLDDRSQKNIFLIKSLMSEKPLVSRSDPVSCTTTYSSESGTLKIDEDLCREGALYVTYPNDPQEKEGEFINSGTGTVEAKDICAAFAAEVCTRRVITLYPENTLTSLLIQPQPWVHKANHPPGSFEQYPFYNCFLNETTHTMVVVQCVIKHIHRSHLLDEELINAYRSLSNPHTSDITKIGKIDRGTKKR
jgi:hypothetical protein